MGSTEDSMDISFDVQSPSITPTLNSLRAHDESPPLTPILNHADVSLSTHYGTSSPPSPEWSLVSHQHGQQIQNPFDQLSYHQTSATTDNLVDDAGDRRGILLSLATIEQMLFPKKQIFSTIKESRDQPLPMFILDKLYQLRSKLDLPDQYLGVDNKKLKGYVNELHDAYGKHREALTVHVGTGSEASPDPLCAILARLKSRRPDIGAINYHGVKTSEFAIILGFFLGGIECYIDSGHIRTEKDMFILGTAIADGGLEAIHRDLLTNNDSLVMSSERSVSDRGDCHFRRPLL